MSDFEEIINTRRSIRQYADKEVSDEDILKILKAGMQAPGSRLGAEPWEFVVIKLTGHSIRHIGNRICQLPVKTCCLKL